MAGGLRHRRSRRRKCSQRCRIQKTQRGDQSATCGCRLGENIYRQQILLIQHLDIKDLLHTNTVFTGLRRESWKEIRADLQTILSSM